MTLSRLLLCGFGTGLMRPASGTWGSLPAVGLALVLVWAIDPESAWRWQIEVTLLLNVVLFSCVCLRFGEDAEAHWGRKDPGQVVADEIAGQSLALLVLPWVAMTDWPSVRRNLVIAAVAFLAFRGFDIIKPPPANALQKLPAGAGILVDDLFAGVYALILTQLVVRVLLGWG